MIKAVIFDCFGVICVGARSYVVSRCPESLRSRLNELFDQADYGFITTAEFVEQAAELLGITGEELRSMLDSRYARNEQVLHTIRHLRGSVKTALLSNANDSIIRRLFSPEELDELFDEVIISSEVGIIKPQPELFELAATRLGCLPSECIMIDDIEVNIQGAAMAGMQGIVFADMEQCKHELKEAGINA